MRVRPTVSALLREVLDIPEHAGAEDYVLRLTDSIEPAAVARTVDEYVVTPALAEAFDAALGLVAESLTVRGEPGRVPGRVVRIGQEPLHGGPARAAAARPGGAG